MNGLGFVRGNLVRDVASLNKMELLPWDCWGVILNEQMDNPDDLAVLDKVADLTAGDVPDFETIHSCYESDPRFHVNNTLLSYVDGTMVEVDMA
jgi:hypothetical protein